jgi:hypothetical protein
MSLRRLTGVQLGYLNWLSRICCGECTDSFLCQIGWGRVVPGNSERTAMSLEKRGYLQRQIISHQLQAHITRAGRSVVNRADEQRVRRIKS